MFPKKYFTKKNNILLFIKDGSDFLDGMFRRYPDFSGSFNGPVTFSVLFLYVLLIYLFVNWLKRIFCQVCIMWFFYSYSEFQRNPSICSQIILHKVSVAWIGGGPTVEIWLKMLKSNKQTKLIQCYIPLK